MCYGGCDCERCAGKPLAERNSDRQQCSDDWEKMTSEKPVVIFDKLYPGVDTLADIDMDINEAISSEYNPKAHVLNGAFQGTVQVTITYIPKGKQ